MLIYLASGDTVTVTMGITHFHTFAPRNRRMFEYKFSGDQGTGRFGDGDIIDLTVDGRISLLSELRLEYSTALDARYQWFIQFR